MCAVLPLLAAESGSGFRLAPSDSVVSVISAAERPLSVRSPAGIWAVGLALVWFGLAYRQRRVALWEPAMVLIGGVLALTRLGNAWLDAAAMLGPLVRRTSIAQPKLALASILSAGSVLTAVLIVAFSRPPVLPLGVSLSTGTTAEQEARWLTPHGTILTNWRWAPDLQNQVGQRRVVLGAGGFSSESSDFWLDYVRLAQGHERWAELLRQMDVDMVVLEAADEQRALADLVKASPNWQVIYAQEGTLMALRVQ
jgi:hypothetical protein